MKDLCQVCKNYFACTYGEGKKINPQKVKQAEEFEGCWIVIECELFKEYPKQGEDRETI